MTSLTLDPLHIVVLLGAIQGVLLAGALVARPRNRTANRLLAVAMLAFSAFLASNVYHSAQLETRFPHFFGIAYPLPFVFGPLVYLYAAFAADRSRQFTARDCVHFVPFIAIVVAAIPIYAMSGDEKLAFYRDVLAGHRTAVMTVADPLKYALGLGYGVATLLFLRHHRERVKESYSSTALVDLQWLFWLGSAAGAIWLLASTYDSLLSMSGMTFARADDVVSLAMALLVYAIGYRALRQPEVYRYETGEYPIASSAAILVDAPADVPAADSARYENSGLSDAQAERLKTKLLVAMDERRLWQDSELTLADLAGALGTTSHKLSEVLNASVGQTFYDFVNGYRVRDVQRRIVSGEARSRKMLALAMDAGFASKSTFNQVFKKHTGQTPSDFRESAEAMLQTTSNPSESTGLDVRTDR